MILIEGQRSCTAWASFRPSMLPGIWMSVNSSEMSERDSRIDIASSALTASTGRNPASSTMSTARIRRIISSSTTSTFGTGVRSVDMDSLTLSRGAMELPELYANVDTAVAWPLGGCRAPRHGLLLRLSSEDSELIRNVRRVCHRNAINGAHDQSELSGQR